MMAGCEGLMDCCRKARQLGFHDGWTHSTDGLYIRNRRMGFYVVRKSYCPEFPLLVVYNAHGLRITMAAGIYLEIHNARATSVHIQSQATGIMIAGNAGLLGTNCTDR